MERKPKIIFYGNPTGNNNNYFRKLFEEGSMAKKQLSPEALQHYLQTHSPSRKERRVFEARYRKQQKQIASGKLKPKKVKFEKITLWQRIKTNITNFFKRK